jgi:hypothetical protein
MRGGLDHPRPRGRILITPEAGGPRPDVVPIPLSRKLRPGACASNDLDRRESVPSDRSTWSRALSAAPHGQRLPGDCNSSKSTGGLAAMNHCVRPPGGRRRAVHPVPCFRLSLTAGADSGRHSRRLYLRLYCAYGPSLVRSTARGRRGHQPQPRPVTHKTELWGCSQVGDAQS